MSLVETTCNLTIIISLTIIRVEDEMNRKKQIKFYNGLNSLEMEERNIDKEVIKNVNSSLKKCDKLAKYQYLSQKILQCC